MTISGADEDVAAEILGILRGALPFRGLEIDEKEKKRAPISLKERETIIKSFLAVELMRDLSTWGAYSSKDPQYDDEPALWAGMNAGESKGEAKSQDQLNILTAISLAAREQLWNPDSTLANLQDHVRNSWLKKRSRGDLDQREQIISQYINQDLMRWLNEMRDLFPIRNWQEARLRELQAKRPGMIVTKVNDASLAQFLKLGEILAYYPSAGKKINVVFLALSFETMEIEAGCLREQNSLI